MAKWDEKKSMLCEWTPLVEIHIYNGKSSDVTFGATCNFDYLAAPSTAKSILRVLSCPKGNPPR